MPRGNQQKGQQGGQHAQASCFFETLESRTLLDGDLTGSFAAFQDPVQLAGDRIELDLFIGNNGSSAISGTLEVDFYASRDGTLNPAVDPLISREKVRGRLAPGQSELATFQVEAPLNLEGGDWRVIAVLNPDNTLAESNTSNNTLVSQVGMLVVPDYDLAGALGDLKFPDGILAGNSAKGTARVLVENQGAFATPKAAVVDVRVYARASTAADTASILSGDILLGEAANQKLGNLRPGKPKAINLKLAAGAALPAATYKLVVAVDAGNDLAESDESNNVSVLAGQTFTVSPPYWKLDAAISSKAKLPTAVVSGDGTKIKLPVTVANTGNVPLNTGQTFDLAVYADRAGGGSTLLTTLDDVSISKLAPGKPKAFNLNLLLPPGLADGDYTLRVVADASGDVPQSSTADNAASTTQTIAVAQGFVTTDVALSKLSVKPLMTGDSGKGTVALAIENRGNVTHPKDARLDVVVALRPTNGASNGANDILVGTAQNASIGNLKPGKAKKVNVKVLIPDTLSPDRYAVVVATAPATGNPITTATALGTADPLGSATVLVSNLAPPNINNQVGTYRIKRGTNPLDSKGSGRIAFSDQGTYVRAENGGVAAIGTYTYTPTGFSTARILMNDSELGVLGGTLDFSKTDQATYDLAGLSFGGTQSGTFKFDPFT